eukprot:7786903-Alexandrium_andersonii.AAC.3
MTCHQASGQAQGQSDLRNMPCPRTAQLLSTLECASHACMGDAARRLVLSCAPTQLFGRKLGQRLRSATKRQQLPKSVLGFLGLLRAVFLCSLSGGATGPPDPPKSASSAHRKR